MPFGDRRIGGGDFTGKNAGRRTNAANMNFPAQIQQTPQPQAPVPQPQQRQQFRDNTAARVFTPRNQQPAPTPPTAPAVDQNQFRQRFNQGAITPPAFDQNQFRRRFNQGAIPQQPQNPAPAQTPNPAIEENRTRRTQRFNQGLIRNPYPTTPTFPPVIMGPGNQPIRDDRQPGERTQRRRTRNGPPQNLPNQPLGQNFPGLRDWQNGNWQNDNNRQSQRKRRSGRLNQNFPNGRHQDDRNPNYGSQKPRDYLKRKNWREQYRGYQFYQKHLPRGYYQPRPERFQNYIAIDYNNCPPWQQYDYGQYNDEGYFENDPLKGRFGEASAFWDSRRNVYTIFYPETCEMRGDEMYAYGWDYNTGRYGWIPVECYYDDYDAYVQGPDGRPVLCTPSFNVSANVNVGGLDISGYYAGNQNWGVRVGGSWNRGNWQDAWQNFGYNLPQTYRF